MTETDTSRVEQAFSLLMEDADAQNFQPCEMTGLMPEDEREIADLLRALLARAEKAEAKLEAMPDRSVYIANHRQAHCIQATAAAMGGDYTATIDGLPKAARHLRERLEKAEAERDTAWNDAIEAAAKYHDHFLMVKTWIDVEQVISSTEAIRALKKGDSHE